MDTQDDRRAEAHNPYAPPRQDGYAASTPSYAPGLTIASTGRRLVNLILDYVGILLLSVAMGMFLTMIGLGDLVDQVNDTLFGFFLMVVYYVPLEALFGVTLGKLVTGTRVVMEDGSPPGFGRILLRTLCRFIPFEPFSFLGGRGRPVGFHDSISKTRVIFVRARPD